MLIDRPDLMLAFTEVARRLSFSVAARELGISASSVSRKVTLIERQLGVRLLHRTTRSIELTDVGERFFQGCLTALEAIAAAEADIRSAKSEAEGTLRLHIPLTFGRLNVVPAIPGFLKRYPKLRLDIVMSDEYRDFVKERIDLAIRIGELDNTRLIAKALGRNRRLLVASPEFLRQIGVPRHPRDLEKLPCLSLSHLKTGDSWRLVRGKTAYVARVTGPLRANNGDAVLRAALAGCGIAMLGRFPGTQRA